MDASKELISRILEQKKIWNLNVRVLTWPQKYGLPWHDIQFEANFGGEVHIGRGTANSENLALTIAAVELLERISIFEAEIYASNGIAAHFDPSIAGQSALLELIERDRLLNHLHGKMPFQKLPQKFSPAQMVAVEMLHKQGIQIEVWGLRQLGHVITRICLATGAQAPYPFGLMIGLGSAATEDRAVDGAFRECLRHAVVAIEHGQAPLSIEEFGLLSRHTPEEHHRLALDTDYARQFRQHFCAEGFKGQVDQEFANVQIHDVPVPDCVKGFISVKQARTVDAQDLYFGPAVDGDINQRALDRFCGKIGSRAFQFFHPLS